MMKTLRQVEHVEEIIKRSRFIAMATHAQSVDEAMTFISNNQHSDANHHCWAYKIGKIYRFNDDGEPAGTAGKPIYNAIERQSLDQLVILVIRYFGGIKLGAGGLIRAYGGTAAKLIHQANLIELIETSDFQCIVDFAHIDQCHRVLNQYAQTSIDHIYQADGAVVSTTIKTSDRKLIQDKLTQALKGQVRWPDAGAQK